MSWTLFKDPIRISKNQVKFYLFFSNLKFSNVSFLVCIVTFFDFINLSSFFLSETYFFSYKHLDRVTYLCSNSHLFYLKFCFSLYKNDFKLRLEIQYVFFYTVLFDLQAFHIQSNQINITHHITTLVKQKKK